jgi:hypothetical protein
MMAYHQDYAARLFYGKGEEEVEDWLAHFEVVASVNEWDDRKKLKMAPVSFCEEALRWFRGLRQEDIGQSWSLFRKKMLRQFRPGDYEERLRERLKNLVQLTGMPVEVYADKLRSLFTNLPDVSEIHRVDKFMSGLSVHLQRYSGSQVSQCLIKK